jgi:7-cyano-7-deazaguanine synthase in queuosine biosynthesis
MNITIEQDITEGLHELSLLRISCEGIQREFRLDVDFSAIIDFSWKEDSLGLDFLIICASVYAIDKIVSRDSTADRWTRTLDVVIPVQNQELWAAASDGLANSVSFLTGDQWNFTFVVARRSFSQRRSNRRKGACGFPKSPVVSLLSGGLDSFIGAIDLLNKYPESKLLFISHYDGQVSGPATEQTKLFRILSQRYQQRARHLQVRTGVNEVKVDGDKYKFETTFRSRSLIFLGLAVYAALKVGGNATVLIPENGPIALNMPLNPSRRGACSTRTVHPFFISSINEVLHSVGIQNVIQNPYMFKTKGEMVKECVDKNILAEGLPLSNSCGKAGRKMHWTNKNAHACGVCIPCLLRCAALHSAGLDIGIYGNDGFYGDPANYPDLHALLGLVKSQPTDYEIKKRLIANGHIPLAELSQHAGVVKRMIGEVSKWITEKGSAKACRLAGLKRTAI